MRLITHEVQVELKIHLRPSEREAFAAYVDHMGYSVTVDNCQQMVERFHDSYQGKWESLEDYAYEFIENCGYLNGVSESLRNYFDYAGYGKDLELNGDIWTHQSEYKSVLVFSNI